MTASTKVDLRSAFNKCDVVLNSDRFSRDQELQKMPPLVLIIDPRTADPALRTIEALRHVQVCAACSRGYAWSCAARSSFTHGHFERMRMRRESNGRVTAPF